MKDETKFLLKALEKERCYIIVMSYLRDETLGHSKVEYITENVKDLGMNLEAIREGYRLPKDYIHPADRELFADALKMAANKQTGFAYGMKICGDDSIIRKVDVAADYSEVDKKTFRIEYVIREIADKKETAIFSEEEKIPEVSRIIEVFKDNRMADILNHISETIGLYSAVVDLSGKKISEPVGPEAYLGDFYDMLERPEYFEMFERLSDSLITSEEPIYVDIKRLSPESGLSAAPIVIGGRHVANWILFAHDKSQTDRLRRIIKHHRKMTEIISEYVYKFYTSTHRKPDDNKYKELIKFDREQSKIISEMLKDIINERKFNLEKYLKKAGELLDVDHVILFKESSKYSEIYSIDDYWSREGKSPATVASFDWKQDRFSEDMRKKINKEGFIVDHKNMTNRIRIGIFQGRARAVMIRPVVAERLYYGRLVIIENRREREWTDEELVFTEQFASIVSSALSKEVRSKGLLKKDEDLFDILDQFSANIFIRDNETGKIIFANKALNRLAKRDMTGENSWNIVPDTKEDIMGYEIGSSTKRVNWRKYIEEFGAIFDISMLPVRFQDGEKGSVFILRLAQD